MNDFENDSNSTIERLQVALSQNRRHWIGRVRRGGGGGGGGGGRRRRRRQRRVVVEEGMVEDGGGGLGEERGRRRRERIGVFPRGKSLSRVGHDDGRGQFRWNAFVEG